MTINLNYKNLLPYIKSNNIVTQEKIGYIKVDSKSSSNSHWLIELPENEGKIIIKQSPNFRALYNKNKILKERNIYNLLQSSQDLESAHSLTPELLHFDDVNLVAIYKIPKQFTTLDKYYENNKLFSTTIAVLVGTNLAKLHYQTMKSFECYQFILNCTEKENDCQLTSPYHIYNYLTNYIEPESLKKIPVQSWRFIGIFHKSEAVKQAVKSLISHHPCCLTHNNIQFQKLLVPINVETLLSENNNSKKSMIKLIDWETCSWGDPAYDLGQAVAGYFLFWLNSMILHSVLDIKKSLQLATTPLEVIRPSIMAMTKAYINSNSTILEVYPDFLLRVIQFAGLALIKQLLREFQLQPYEAINHQEIYFYIAAQLICKPDKFVVSI